jgi:transcriptional regulator with XRE-family HTH domain
MTDDERRFGALLRAGRRSAGLSQAELAHRSGLSIHAISGLECGRTNSPHRNSLHRLADALDLREQARAEFLAAAGRRLAPPIADTRTGSGQRDDSPPGRGGQVVPQQLPAAVPTFVGRHEQLAALSQALHEPGGSAVVVAIGGTAGVGKTALAAQFARQVAGRFGDGQLYVNLRGFAPAGTPVTPAEAIRGFLDAFEVPSAQVPSGLDAQAALYRSVLAGKRVLVLLDNARDEEQVRPLLPAEPGCLAIVTSRRELAGLAAIGGARLLTLDVLAEGEAREQLARHLGHARMATEPQAVSELTRLCARLPLALAIAAARAATRPAFPLAALVDELSDVSGRLDALDTGDPAASMRGVLSWSCQNLSSASAGMFRLVGGLHPGPDITASAAASLAGVSLPEARSLLRQLTRFHLLTEHSPGRYTSHDLLRAYAAEQAIAMDEASRRVALTRTLDHYLHTAHAAALMLGPSREPIALPPARPGVTPEPLVSLQQALAWFQTEHHVLLAAATLATETELDGHAWQIPWTMHTFLDRRGHWHECGALQRTALAAATRLGDKAGQVAARRLLAHNCVRLGDYDQACTHLAVCLKLCQQLGDRAAEARAHQKLSWIAERRADYADALGHAEQSLALLRLSNDRAEQASAFNNVGWCHALLGDHQQARAFCQQAVALHCELGNRYGEAHSWDSLGYAEHQLGQLAEAAACYQHALVIARDVGHRHHLETEILTHLGDTHCAAGDSSAARDAWQQSLDILEEIRHPDADQVRAKLRQLIART